MDWKQITALVTGVVIAALLLTTILVPIIGEASTTEKTFTNVGAYYMTDSDDNYTFVYDPSGKITVNGDDFAFTELPSSSSTLISTDSVEIRLNNYVSSSQGNNALMYISSTGYSRIANTSSTDPVTITVDSGTISYGENTYTYTEGTFRGLNKTGNYVMTSADSSAKVVSSSTVILADGTTQVAHWYDRFYIEGTVESMEVLDAPTGITTSNLSVNVTPISGYVNLVSLNSITFTATDGEHTVDATYNRIIVPAEVTAELSQHLDESSISLLSIVPLLITVGIIMAVVGLFVMRRE